MELRQLRWLLATVEAGSISAAAREGHISQPALSVAIAQLERELRVPLLVRSRDGVRPTDAGRAVIGIARRVVQDAELAAAMAKAAESAPRRVRIGVIEQAGVPALAAGIYAASASGVELEFVEGHRPWDIERLLTGECDVAVVAAPITRPGVRTAVLKEEPRGIMVGPTSELFDARAEDVTFELLAQHPSVDPIGLPRAWEDVWAYAPLMNGQRFRRIGPPVDSVNATLIAAMTTPAMAFVPRGFGLIGAGFGLNYIELAQGPPCTHLLAWREPMTAATRVFIAAASGVPVDDPAGLEP